MIPLTVHFWRRILTEDFEKKVSDLLESQHNFIEEAEPVEAELVRNDIRPKGKRGDELATGIIMTATGCGLPLLVLLLLPLISALILFLAW